MPEPRTQSPQASDAWPQLAAPPRMTQRWLELLRESGDGNAGLVWQGGGAMLGAAVGIVVSEVFDASLFMLLGFMLGAAAGGGINRALRLAVLRDGLVCRGEVVKLDADPNRMTVVYTYEVGGKSSRHDLRTRDPAIVGHTEVGSPVLVIHHPQRMGRHLAFFPGQFAKLEQILGAAPVDAGPSRSALGPGTEAAPELRRYAPAGTPTGTLASPSEAQRVDVAQLVRGWGTLPPAPRPMALRANLNLSPEPSASLQLLAGISFIVTFLVFILDFVGISPPIELIFIPFAVTGVLFALVKLSPMVIGRALLRQGVETSGVVVKVSPSGQGGISYDYDYEVHGRTYRHGTRLRNVAEAARVHEGDPVLVLYDRNKPARSVGLLAHEARLAIDACRAAAR